MESINCSVSCDVVREDGIPDLCRLTLERLGEFVGPPCGHAMYGGS